MPSNFHYNKNLKQFARNLRNEATKGERIVWFEILQNQKMKGYRFIRQRPIANYIADFFCKELMLVIEVDGFTHDDKAVEDKIRDQQLTALGMYTLRIPDNDVFNNIENVIRTIEITIERILEFRERVIDK